VESSDAELLAASGDVLGSQHGSVGGGLVTIGLDLHATGNTAQRLAATGVTQNVSLRTKCPDIVAEGQGRRPSCQCPCVCSRVDEPEIGDVTTDS
jgi:hypothetical protein